MMGMGNFPSKIWHSQEVTEAKKKEASKKLNELEERQKYMRNKMGLPQHCFPKVVKKSKPAGEKIPFRFQAEQTVSFIRDRLIGTHHSPANPEEIAELRSNILKRSMKVYAATQERLADIRYGDSTNALEEIVGIMTNLNINKFKV
jgi:hypothetical protein